MSQQNFDAFTRRAAENVSRRGSLATLGGAGLAALLGSALTADAKKNKNNNKKTKKKIKKKIKKKSLQKCQAQVGQCQTIVTAQQGSAATLACCELLGTCDFTGLVACLEVASSAT